MMKLMMIGGALAMASACASPAVHASPAPSAGACEIRETRTPDGIRLEAVAHADRAIQGGYDFAITAQGSGGASDITQAGQVDLSAGRSATVGAAEISNGRYRAVLTLTDAHGELCRRERQS